MIIAAQLPRPLWGFCPITWEPDFSRTCGFRRYLKGIMYFHLAPFIAKSNDTIFFNIQKTLFFYPFLAQNSEMRFFPKNRASSLLSIYDPLTSCKKLEKNNKPIPRKVRYAPTNEPTNERTNEQAWIYRSLLLEQGTNNNNNNNNKTKK